VGRDGRGIEIYDYFLDRLARFDGLGIPPLHEDIEPEERSGLQLDIEDDKEDCSAPAPPVPAQIVQRDTATTQTTADALWQGLAQPFIMPKALTVTRGAT
jgi:hypothetical protein